MNRIYSKIRTSLIVKCKLLFSLIILLVACPLWGQVNNKRYVTENDYPLWGKLYQEQLSPSGNWVSFKMIYEPGLDTLFIKNTDTYKTHSFPKGHKGEFASNEKWFVYYIKTGGVGLFDIHKKQNRIFPEADEFLWAATGNHLAIYMKEAQKLIVHNLKDSTQEELEGVTEFDFNFKGDRLAYLQIENDTYQLKYLELSRPYKTRTVHKSASSFSKLKWHQTNNSLIFLEAFEHLGFREKSHIVHYYHDKLRSFDHRNHPGFPIDTHIPESYGRDGSGFFISKYDDGVFIPVKKWTSKFDTVKKWSEGDLEIWHYKDTEVFPRKNWIKDNETDARLAFWDMDNSEFTKITSREHPYHILNENHTHVLIYSHLEYLPIYEHQGQYSDFYLMDLKTKNHSLFLKKQPIGTLVSASPGGKYFCYFRENGWWLYDIEKKNHINFTKDIPEPLFKKGGHSLVKIAPVSYPVWTKGDKVLFISGLRDVWKINPVDKKIIRLTNGKKEGLIYEISKGSNMNTDFTIHLRNKGILIKGSEELVLRGVDPIKKTTGFFLWKKNKGLSTISFGDVFVDELFTSKDKSLMVYREQRYDSPPKLKILKNGTSRNIHQSNPHQKQFHWGTSKIIHYNSSKNDPLQGILYYPANFDPKKKYPLIVRPYEIQTRYYNHYVNPSNYGDEQFNVTNYTTQGYFVLYPDVKFEKGNVGISTVDCVIAATEKVMEQDYIDTNSIGLCGSSFGGYQTFFIITQTNIFSAAISGSGYSDLFSWSLSIVPGFLDRPEMNSFEFGQTRMGNPYYEAMDNYMANSPIHQVMKIETPLLITFGKKDPRVKWEQGLYMYIALRRLNKKTIMLVYPDEGHSFMKRANQKDLTKKMIEWFDHHLKKKGPKEWMTEVNQY